MIKLANNIKYFRDKNNLSQEQLADLLNISRPTISKWENNEQLPDVTTLEKLSHIFKISMDHLVGNSYFKEDILREVNRIYQTKNEDVNERMLQIIDYMRQNEEMEKMAYELSQLPPNKRKTIEDILTTTVQRILKLM